jgi:hypothetical protein
MSAGIVVVTGLQWFSADPPDMPGYMHYVTTASFKIFHLVVQIRMMKSRRMRWTGHVARMGRREMRIGYWWESQTTRKTKR